MTDVDAVERMAAQLCESRWGEGHWDKPGIKRSYWRRQARVLLAEQQAAKQSTYDAIKDSLANIMGGRW